MFAALTPRYSWTHRPKHPRLGRGSFDLERRHVGRLRRVGRQRGDERANRRRVTVADEFERLAGGRGVESFLDAVVALVSRDTLVKVKKYAEADWKPADARTDDAFQNYVSGSLQNGAASRGDD